MLKRSLREKLPSARIFVNGVTLVVGTVTPWHFIVTSQMAHIFPVWVTVTETGSRTPPAAWAVSPVKIELGGGPAGAPAGALSVRRVNGRVQPRQPRPLTRTVPVAFWPSADPCALTRSMCPRSREWPLAVNAGAAVSLPLMRTNTGPQLVFPHLTARPARALTRPSGRTTRPIVGFAVRLPRYALPP